jgi:hypothetical protein
MHFSTSPLRGRTGKEREVDNGQLSFFEILLPSEGFAILWNPLERGCNIHPR